MSGDQRRFDKPRQNDPARMKGNAADKEARDERSRREDEPDTMRRQMRERGQQMRPQQQQAQTRQPSSASGSGSGSGSRQQKPGQQASPARPGQAGQQAQRSSRPQQPPRQRKK